MSLKRKDNNKDVFNIKNVNLDNIIESLPDAAFIIDVNGKVIYWNIAAEELTGVKKDKIIGKNNYEYSKIFHGKRRPALIDYVFGSKEDIDKYYNPYQINNNTLVAETFCPNIGEDGIYIWAKASKLFDNQGDIIGAIETIRNITGQRKREFLMRSRLDIMKYASSASLNSVLQKIIDNACEITNSSLGFYYFVGKNENRLTQKVYSAQTLKECKTKEGLPSNVEDTVLVARCIEKRGPLICNDFALESKSKNLPDGHPFVTRYLLVPVLRGGQIKSIIGIANKINNYTDSDIQMLTDFADLAWEIIEQKRSEEKIQYLSFHDSLTGLHNRAYMDEQISNVDNKKQLPISIVMLDLNGLKLVNDTYGHEIGDEMLKYTAKIIKESCREGETIARWGGDEFVILMPRASEKELEALSKRIMDKTKRAYIKDVPISLALGTGIKKSSEDSIEDVLKTAEDNMYQQKLAKSRSARSAVLNTLIKTLEAKSYETEAHAQRMLIIAWKIGEKMGLGETELNRLQLLITLHDIGKVNIPEETLTKNGPLSDNEWELIKKHPEIGYRIALATEEFSHVAEDILSHHERWDGKGYPRGLKGKEIPLLARITAIADAYDVMSNGRPYKKAMEKEEIIAEFLKCRGTQFDPELVDIFVQILRSSKI